MEILLCRVILIFFLSIGISIQCQTFTNSDVIFKVEGLASEYKERFLKKETKERLVEYLNEFQFPKEMAPIRINVYYKGGVGAVEAKINYDVMSFYSGTKYGLHHKNNRWTGDGVGVFLEYQLFGILSDYIRTVATKGMYYDQDIIKFESYISLNDNNGNEALFSAVNDFDRRGFFIPYMSSRCMVKYKGKPYIVTATNRSTLSELKYFTVGKTTGLAGEKKAGYYFLKFHNLEELEKAERLRKQKEEEEKRIREQKRLERLRLERDSFSVLTSNKFNNYQEHLGERQIDKINFRLDAYLLDSISSESIEECFVQGKIKVSKEGLKTLEISHILGISKDRILKILNDFTLDPITKYDISVDSYLDFKIKYKRKSKYIVFKRINGEINYKKGEELLNESEKRLLEKYFDEQKLEGKVRANLFEHNFNNAGRNTIDIIEYKKKKDYTNLQYASLIALLLVLAYSE